MNLPKITYSARISSDTLSFKDTEEIYGGTYTKTNPISVDLRIWNNKYGLADVKDLENFALNFYFNDYEDSSLLKYLTVVYNNNEELNLEIKDRVASATFFNSVIIKGTANNGNDSDTDNYIDLKIIFNTSLDNETTLKASDIKSLFVEIVTI